jgi:hypothetical protein
LKNVPRPRTNCEHNPDSCANVYVFTALLYCQTNHPLGKFKVAKHVNTARSSTVSSRPNVARTPSSPAVESSPTTGAPVFSGDLVREPSEIEMNPVPARAGIESAVSSVTLPGGTTDIESGTLVPMTPRKWWKRSGVPREHAPETADSYNKSPRTLFWVILSCSYANPLLVFVPVGIALHYTHHNPTLVFIINFLAIIPLAAV